MLPLPSHRLLKVVYSTTDSIVDTQSCSAGVKQAVSGSVSWLKKFRADLRDSIRVVKEQRGRAGTHKENGKSVSSRHSLLAYSPPLANHLESADYSGVQGGFVAQLARFTVFTSLRCQEYGCCLLSTYWHLAACDKAASKQHVICVVSIAVSMSHPILLDCAFTVLLALQAARARCLDGYARIRASLFLLVNTFYSMVSSHISA